MGFGDFFSSLFGSDGNKVTRARMSEDEAYRPDREMPDFAKSAIGYGGQRKDGGHDHRTNKGNDRTRAQREGDRKRRKHDSSDAE